MLQNQNASENPIDDSDIETHQDPGRARGPVALHVAGAPAAFEGLTRSLAAAPFQSVSDLDALVADLVGNPKAQAVVIYPNPVLVIGTRLEEGDKPADAIEAWRRDTERLLGVFRRDRRKVTLVDGHAALAAPALFHRLLDARVPFSVGGLPDEEAGADGELAGLPHLIAAQALRQDDVAAPLVAELEASSLPLEPAYRIDVDDLVEKWATAVAATGSSPADEELAEENELLLHQLHTVQEELEAHFLENRRFDSRLDEMQAEAKRARVAAEKARLARRSLQEEFNEAGAAWKEERKALTDRLTWTANDLTAIRQSLSWKVTAPLRRVLGLFIGGSKL